eukprot:TRINITY_DN38407_c0_g1_i1.p1 TRINITY_DN38407_c0_g1~~TRINITY_DN38407_c0_g1_i1.p1  ORF type:complete len:151 (+),score=47.91 TRINITY_DN38407_c0_g1_i1:151-603(+)
MSNLIDIADASGQLDGLSEEERRALRRSRFSPLPPISSAASQPSQPRLAHPGGPLATNKAVALAKFLQRKLEEPGGSSSLNPDLVERAVQNAKKALHSENNSSALRNIRHVESFPDAVEETSEKLKVGPSKKNKKKKKAKKLKTKKQKGG